MAGELTHESVILQSRLTYGKYTYIDPEILTVAPDVPGRPGIACFEISTSPDFVNCFRTKWLDAVAERDFIVKTLVVGLAPGTKYYYRLIFGADRETTRFGPVRSFPTLAGKGKGGQASFAIITGILTLSWPRATTYTTTSRR
jgi:alkaline phosphatase/alkaline phosphatase D